MTVVIVIVAEIVVIYLATYFHRHHKIILGGHFPLNVFLFSKINKKTNGSTGVKCSLQANDVMLLCKYYTKARTYRSPRNERAGKSATLTLL